MSDEPSPCDGLPSLELVDRLKDMLMGSGMTARAVDGLDPVLLMVLAELVQQSDRQQQRLLALGERNTRLAFDADRLRSQRDALRIAIAKERSRVRGEEDPAGRARELASFFELSDRIDRDGRPLGA